MSTKLLVAVAAVLMGAVLVALAAAGTLESGLEWGDVVVSGLAAAAFGGVVARQALRGRRR